MRQRLFVIFGENAAGASGGDRQARERRQLAGEGLGRGDADFRSGKRRHEDIAFARDARCRHIHDREDMLFVRAGIAQRSERVGGLSRLRNEDREIARRQWHVAIAEFGRDIDVDR